MSLPSHGANPHYFVQAMGLQLPEHAIDFSENVNPLGVPRVVRDRWNQYIEAITTYPDPHASQLREKLANDLNVSIDQLIVGNGAAELILLIANYFRKKRVLIVEPTFSEYRDACLTYDCEIIRYQLLQESSWDIQVESLLEAINGVDILFLCHPNNPTGTTIERSTLIQVFSRAREKNVTVIIDEAFYDFCTENVSVIPYIEEFHNLVVLRSLTKMYAIPSLRLGYVVARKEFVSELKKFQQPWSVNGMAQQVGLDCISDEEHAIDTKTFIREERKRMFKLLSDIGYEVSPSVVNFYLLKPKGTNEDLTPLITFLIRNGVIPRHTYNFLGLEGKYIRLAIKTRQDNDLLLSVLERWSQRP
ncbi:threonine-phosphate decarboxylase CobD [Alkalihalobacterium alkalinitrilicum]|uniref:threonine-phosphate decarboxylase CobD n=1 Tax=Alkalihalobacterium alkalinitrilicum TaxID=427920 RepID=UPI000995CD23|nr:threonine-phosphate decarboxylase CobD [Alkalihalobacterium alkalinitrilicum]